MYLEIENGIVEFDYEMTKEYYKNLTVCDCLGCRNYFAQVAEKLPNCKDFLLKLGVDISKADEIGWIEYKNDTFLYLFASYTIPGRILKHPDNISFIKDAISYEIKIDSEYVPNEQKGEFFVVSICNLCLPNILGKIK